MPSCSSPRHFIGEATSNVFDAESALLDPGDGQHPTLVAQHAPQEVGGDQPDGGRQPLDGGVRRTQRGARSDVEQPAATADRADQDRPALADLEDPGLGARGDRRRLRDPESGELDAARRRRAGRRDHQRQLWPCLAARHLRRCDWCRRPAVADGSAWLARSVRPRAPAATAEGGTGILRVDRPIRRAGVRATACSGSTPRADRPRDGHRATAKRARPQRRRAPWRPGVGLRLDRRVPMWSTRARCAAARRRPGCCGATRRACW